MRTTAIDFGTTNCIVSFYESEDIKIAKVYGGQDQIPSIIAYPYEDLDNPEIGNRTLKGNTNYSYFEAFKMLLSEQPDSELLKGHQYTDQFTPVKVAKDFIHLLLEKIKNDYGEIGDLYVTIPHIWEKSTNLKSKEVLRSIFEDIGYPVKRFIPEPVAAASFFCYKYRKVNNKPFGGHLLVVDYGGGTLDISLCKMDDKGLTVLETTGSGENSINSIGNGGIAYDKDICLKILEDNGINPGTNIDNDPTFQTLLYNFEDQKIKSTIPIRKALGTYIAEPTLDRKITAFNLKFNNKELDVKPSTFHYIFNSEKYARRLENELDKIKRYISSNKIDSYHKNTFRIIPVGGFSSFPLVEFALLECMNPGEKNVDDQRFARPNEINANERGLAISEGACAIGAGLIDLTPTIMWNIGVQFVEFTATGIQNRDFTVFAKGDKYDKYKDRVKLVNGNILSLPKEARDAPFKLFVEFDDEKKAIPLFSNNEFFPEFTNDLLKYKMYSQILEDDFLIIIEPLNSRGVSKSVKLNRLFEMLHSGTSFVES